MRREPLRMVALLATAASLGGCAGGRAADSPRQGEVVGFRAVLEEDAPTLLAAFRAKAEASGCTTVRADEVAVVERCADGEISIEKRGLEVTVACPRTGLEACHARFERISQRASE